jgi:hypothetical protein
MSRMAEFFIAENRQPQRARRDTKSFSGEVSFVYLRVLCGFKLFVGPGDGLALQRLQYLTRRICPRPAGQACTGVCATPT